MKLKLASTSQRIVAFIIDFVIISILVNLLTDLIYFVIKFDSTTIDVVSEIFLTKLMEIVEANASGASITNQMIILQDYAMQLMKLAGIQMACSAGASLVVFMLYMIMLPLLWKNQTVGRAIMKCKVVYPNTKNLPETDHKKKTVGVFFLRELVVGWLLYYMIGNLIVLIIAIVYYHSRKRTLADIISKTETVSYVEADNIEENNDVIDADVKPLNTENPQEDPFKINPEEYNYDNDTKKKDDDYVIF